MANTIYLYKKIYTHKEEYIDINSFILIQTLSYDHVSLNPTQSK